MPLIDGICGMVNERMQRASGDVSGDDSERTCNARYTILVLACSGWWWVAAEPAHVRRVAEGARAPARRVDSTVE